MSYSKSLFSYFEFIEKPFTTSKVVDYKLNVSNIDTNAKLDIGFEDNIAISRVLSNIFLFIQFLHFSSNNENMACFYIGFGGKKKEYAFVRINRLPWWISWTKKQ